MKYWVVQAPRVDREKLLIRINGSDKPEGVQWYNYIQLKTKGKKIVCELRGDDIPEIENKQPGRIHINEPLRGKLGLKIGESPEFQIEKALHLLKPLYFIRYHPNDVVRVSTWLGIIAIVISIIAILIAFFT